MLRSGAKHSPQKVIGALPPAAPMKALALLAATIFAAMVFSGCVSNDPQTAEDIVEDPKPELPIYEPHVVVATLDTGANPFHPAWTRDQYRHPSLFIPGYPQAAEAIHLTINASSFSESVEASKAELSKLVNKSFPYWFPGTNIIGTWAHPTDNKPIFDLTGSSHSHGASASSQIAGKGYSMSPDAYVVIMDRTNDGGGGTSVYKSNADGLRWAADQPWIDIIHTNIQNPVPLARGATGVVPATFTEGYPEAVAYALSKGKIVVSAGGNFWVEPTETSPHAGVPGVLVAGANDNCGYTDFSNPNPHIVMDGYQTVAAEARGFKNSTFGGTSSASPRITGYMADLLLKIRREFNYTQGIKDGALVVLEPGPNLTLPKMGPLADGRLLAAELHEVARKTANPNPHPSKFDGGQSVCIPQPVDLPVAFYPKMGYGEVSEHTIEAAFEVAIGKRPMPSRPVEDAYYAASEELRKASWSTLPV
jgi:hypothetical protein